MAVNHRAPSREEDGMNRIGVWIVFGLAVVALSATASEKVKTLSQKYPASGLSLVNIDVPVGDARVSLD
jgi:hypothetical protein